MTTGLETVSSRSRVNGVFRMVRRLLVGSHPPMTRPRPRTLLPFLATVVVSLSAAASASAAVPTPSLRVEAITRTSATLVGNLAPAEAGAKYFFQYGKEQINCPSELRAPKTGELTAPASETLPGLNVTGLSPNTEYLVCLHVFNKAHTEETETNAVRFTTLGPPEQPETLAPEAVTSGSATLEGTVFPASTPELGSTYEFFYRASATECQGEGSVSAPEPAGEALGEAEHVEAPVSLAPHTLYTVCLAVTNAFSETTVGTATTFETGPPEQPATRQATSVTATSAVLNGELNPFSSGMAGFFFNYRIAPAPYEGLTCEGEDTTPLETEVSGLELNVSQTVEGLRPSTEYAFCVDSSHDGEVAQGAPLKFTTLPLAPAVVSETGAAYSPFEARFEALVNPNNQTTSCTFEYGPTTSYGTSVPCEQATLEGFGEQGVGVTVSRLFPGTTYHYRVSLTNKSGETQAGSDEELPTPALAAAVVEGTTSSAVTPSGATLEAQVNPGFQRTSCVFEYGTASVSEHRASCSPSVLEGGAQGVTVTLTGQAPETTIHFRVLATNASGETLGEEAEFTTLALTAPVIESESYYASPYEASMQANINPAFQETTCRFEYAETEAALSEGHGTSVACPATLKASGNGVATEATAAGLTPGTVYFYRVLATNATGSTPGPVKELKTQTPKPPVIESEGASDNTLAGVTLEAQVNSSYQETAYTFEYAETEKALLEGHGTSVPGGTIPAGKLVEETPDRLATAELSGLPVNRLFYFRVLAHNAAGTAKHLLVVQSFTSASEPTATTGPVTVAATATTVTVSGTVDPDGLPSSYYVQYGGAAYGKQTLPVQLPAGTSAVPVSIPIEGLTPGSSYHYRLLAVNHDATGEQVAYGQDATFTTLSTPPGLTGVTVGAIGQSTATVTGDLEPDGLSTRYELQLGTTPGALSQLAAGNASTNTPLTFALGSLTPGTAYYYTLTASNLDGTTPVAGSFTTAAAPPGAPQIAQPASPILLNIPIGAFPTETKPKPPLTNAQKLKKALTQCHKDKKKTKRQKCERAAHKHYPVKKKATK